MTFFYRFDCLQCRQMEAGMQELIRTIQNTLNKCEEDFCNRQEEYLKKYFNEDNSPIMVEFKIPIINNDKDNTDSTETSDYQSVQYATVQVPKISLVPVEQMLISEAEIEMDMYLKLPRDSSINLNNNERLPIISRRIPAKLKLKFVPHAPCNGLLEIKDKIISQQF